jgi:hypothetical protein
MKGRKVRLEAVESDVQIQTEIDSIASEPPLISIDPGNELPLLPSRSCPDTFTDSRKATRKSA